MADYFVCIICDRPNRNADFQVRIGTSNDVKKTRMDLEAARSDDLRTYAVYSGNIARVVAEFEQRFHSVGIQRGWYRVKRELLDDFINTVDKWEDVKYWTESKAKAPRRTAKAEDERGVDQRSTDRKPDRAPDRAPEKSDRKSDRAPEKPDRKPERSSDRKSDLRSSDRKSTDRRSKKYDSDSDSSSSR